MVSLCAAEATEPNPGDMLPRIFAATVAVRTYDAEQHLLGEGGGCLVTLPQPHADVLCGVATCLHLFAGAAQVELHTADGVPLPVNGVLAEDSDSDLVLLDVAWPSGVKALMPDSSLPLDNTPMLLVTPAQTVLKGTLSEREAADFDEMTCPVAPTFTGIPLVNANGVLLGLVAPPLREGAKSATWPSGPATGRAASHNSAPLSAWMAHLPARWPASSEGQYYQVRGWLAAGATEAGTHLETLAIIDQETPTVQLYRGICRYMDDDYQGALDMLGKACVQCAGLRPGTGLPGRCLLPTQSQNGGAGVAATGRAPAGGQEWAQRYLGDAL